MAWPDSYEALLDNPLGTPGPYTARADQINSLRKPLAGRPWVNILAHEPPLDGTSSANTAFTAAAAEAAAIRGDILVPPAIPFRLLNWQMPLNVGLKGVFKLGSHFSPGQIESQIVGGTSGEDLIILPEGLAGYAPLGQRISGIHFKDGRNQLVGENGATWLDIDHCMFSSADEAAILLDGFVQEIFLDGVWFNGGQYGYRQRNNPGSLGSLQLLDKCRFSNVYCLEQSVNGFRIESLTSRTVLFDMLRIILCRGDGFYADGVFRNWVFDTVNTEANGYLGPGLRVAPTTGSITSASTTLTVASGTGIANGDTVTVEGAGVGGRDLYSVVNSGGGTTSLTLATAASTAVTNAEVTKALYSDFKFANTIGSSGDIVFIGVNGGYDRGLGDAMLRYFIDGGGLLDAAIIGGSQNINPRDIYDPNAGMKDVTGTGRFKIRRPMIRERFLHSTFGRRAGPTIVGAALGQDLWLGLNDSNNATTGTYGKVRVGKYDATGNQVFAIRSDGTIERNAAGTVIDATGTGTPEGVVTGAIGSRYTNLTNGDVYRKTSGTGNTGWVTP